MRWIAELSLSGWVTPAYELNENSANAQLRNGDVTHLTKYLLRLTWTGELSYRALILGKE